MVNNRIIKKDINIKNFNTIINNSILEKADLALKSTRGFLSQQYDLFDNKEKFNVVVEEIKNQLKKINKDMDYNLVAAWTVIGKENSYHTVHRHNEANLNHIATVLYLNVPESNMHQSGDFYYLVNDNNNNISCETITPKKGTLIIMPIDLLHGSYPQSKGTRQTLNMDFEIINKNG
jgi:hypothetical protein